MAAASTYDDTASARLSSGAIRGFCPPANPNLRSREIQEHILGVGTNHMHSGGGVRSGTGKSTLLKVLVRGYLPTSGGVAIDGKPLNRVDVKRSVAICEQIAMVSTGTTTTCGSQREFEVPSKN
eukprot:1195010-Prorocentrum_minimum.AAC.4